MKRRLAAMVGAISLGAGGALLPLLVSAQEHGGGAFEAQERAQEASADWGLVMVITLIATGALFLIAGIGYLYRRERGLEWVFQLPDAPHDEHH